MLRHLDKGEIVTVTTNEESSYFLGFDDNAAAERARGAEALRYNELAVIPFTAIV